jgi:hypothetical protein
MVDATSIGRIRSHASCGESGASTSGVFDLHGGSGKVIYLTAAISSKERIARFQQFQLDSAREQLLVDVETSKRNSQAILSTAEELGFRFVPAKKNRPKRLVEIPSSTKLAEQLFDGEFGSFVYRLYSAVNHATTYAHMYRMVEVGAPDVDDFLPVRMQYSPADVNVLLAILLTASSRATTSAYELLGFNTTDAVKERQNALQLAQHITNSNRHRRIDDGVRLAR